VTTAARPTPIDKLDTNFLPTQVADGTAWYDVTTIGIEGRGWHDTETPFDRLPVRAKTIVRPPVWELGKHSAGLCVRFVTDATTVSAKWSLTNPSLAMNHMPASGMSGVDLYARIKGKWHWAGTGVPGAQENQSQLAAALLPGKKEMMLYLPLYNGTVSASIGINAEAKLAAAPRRPGKRGRGVVVYGTSIVQGGCASRSGMGYPEILGRALDCYMINLGFSGNGPMDLEMAPFLGELDPAIFVLDGLPNMNATQVAERAVPFVSTLRKARPRTPILLVENISYQRHVVQAPAARDGFALKNIELRKAYQTLLRGGLKNLHYLKGEKLLGSDNLGTVDGTHPTDLGFFRMAQAIGAAAKRLL